MFTFLDTLFNFLFYGSHPFFVCFTILVIEIYFIIHYLLALKLCIFLMSPFLLFRLLFPPLPTYSSKYFDNRYYVYSSLLFLSFSIFASCVINILLPEQLPLEYLLVQTLIINYSRFSFPFSLFLFLLHFHCLLIFLLDVEL